MTTSTRAVTLVWSDEDRHPRLAPVAALGLLLGTLLAVVGLPPADLHGPLYDLGLMCPLCGLTRGLRATMLGDLGRAWSYNPASLVLVAAAVGALARLGVGLWTGRWLNARVRRSPWVVSAVIGAVAALWLNQQLHAELLLS